ncbi:MAG TPA: hypothetical protein VGW40_01990 [Allosphingosinicella sp.]|nr:hypothetical protein [Allosphingosinicella sp.]
MRVHAPEQATKTIYMIGHILAGVAAMVNCAVIVPALEDNSADSAAFGKVAAVCGIVGGVGMLFGTLFRPVDPIRDTGVSILSTGTTLISTGAKIMCWWKATGAEAKAWTETGAMIDGALGMMALVVSCYHFYELAHAADDSARKVAICDETATLCNTFGRFTQAGAILDEDPETKTALAVATAVLSGIYGGLAIAAGLAES